jgi:hypothetical protein
MSRRTLCINPIITPAYQVPIGNPLRGEVRDGEHQSPGLLSPLTPNLSLVQV